MTATETSQSFGAGDFTLHGISFAMRYGTGGNDMFFYTIRHDAKGEWECGTGHMADAVTLVRDRVIASSAAGGLVDFSRGDKRVDNAHVDIHCERKFSA
jgi:hypothetical protein